MIVALGRRDGEAVEGERDDEVATKAARQVERVVGIAFGGVEVALCDLDARARCQRGRQTPGRRRRHHVVGPATG